MAVLILMAAELLLRCSAQPWAPLLNARQAIDWSTAGVGGIPDRPVHCAELSPSATVAQINAALASCPSGQTVFLVAGTYAIDGTVTIPSNVTLRGAGADATILNAVGTGGGDVVSLGSGSVAFTPYRITGGAASGSTSVELSNVSGIEAGMYLVITEINNLAYVSSAGSGGTCNWCDGNWTEKGSLARGQIVAVTGVSGRTVNISPGALRCLCQYSHCHSFQYGGAATPALKIFRCTPTTPAMRRTSACRNAPTAGSRAWNRTTPMAITLKCIGAFTTRSATATFRMRFCTVPEFMIPIFKSHSKTSASLIENNIVERTHRRHHAWNGAQRATWCPTTTPWASSIAARPISTLAASTFTGLIRSSTCSKATLLPQIAEDSVWGTSSQTTAYRNWVVGTNRICSPDERAGRSELLGGKGHYGFQAARAIEIVLPGTRRTTLLATLLDRRRCRSLKGYNFPLAQQASNRVSRHTKLRCGCLWLVLRLWTNERRWRRGRAAAEGCLPVIFWNLLDGFLAWELQQHRRSIAWAPGVTHDCRHRFI